MVESMNPGSQLADLRTLFLFRGVSTEELEAQVHFVSDSYYRLYPAGSVMQSASDPPHGIATVTAGTAVICSDASENAIHLRTISAGDIFGAASIYSCDGGYGTLIRAETDCTVLILPEASVQRVIEASSAVALNYIRFLSDRICFLNRKITAFTAGEASSKLATVLLSYPIPSDGKVELRCNMSELAKSLNMSRASLYRAWDALTDLGVLRRDGSTVQILDLEALKNILL